MTILCADTSTDFAVFALADSQGTLLASLAVRHGRDLSRRLFTAMDSLFGAAGSSIDQVDVFAAGIGPGSFTGVRVAVTTLRTLAQVTGKPLVGVGTLEIIAAGIAGGLPAEALIVSVQPSRKEEVYGAVYDGLGKEVRPPFLATYGELSQVLASLGKPERITLCGAVRGLGEPFGAYARVAIPAPPAEAFATLAARRLEAGDLANSLALNPVYVAKPAISQHKNRQP